MCHVEAIPQSGGTPTLEIHPRSDAIWEEEKRKSHWKPVSIALKNKLEDIYQQQPDKDEVEVPETEYQVHVHARTYH